MMNVAIALVEFAVAGGFLTLARERYRAGLIGASMTALALSVYFTRISLLYAGRALSYAPLERIIDPAVILVNISLLLLALIFAAYESRDRRSKP